MPRMVQGDCLKPITCTSHAAVAARLVDFPNDILRQYNDASTKNRLDRCAALGESARYGLGSIFLMAMFRNITGSLCPAKPKWPLFKSLPG